MNKFTSVICDPTQSTLLLQLFYSCYCILCCHLELVSHLFNHHNLPPFNVGNEIWNWLRRLLIFTLCFNHNHVLPLIKLCFFCFYLHFSNSFLFCIDCCLFCVTLLLSSLCFCFCLFPLLFLLFTVLFQLFLLLQLLLTFLQLLNLFLG